MEVDKKAIGFRIKTIRHNKGMTLNEFGSVVDNADRSIVSRWERGVSLPNNARLKIIAELGDISVDELLYGDFEARIKKILLNKPGVNERYIDLVMAHFSGTNEYPTEEDIFEKYDETVGVFEGAVQKTVAPKMLAYNIHRSIEFLLVFLKDPSKDSEFSNINHALNELAEAVSSYETYFDKTVDEVYNEVITKQ